MKVTEFNDVFFQNIENVSYESKEIIIMGDFNSNSATFLANMYETYFFPILLHPLELAPGHKKSL